MINIDGLEDCERGVLGNFDLWREVEEEKWLAFSVGGEDIIRKYTSGECGWPHWVSMEGLNHRERAVQTSFTPNVATRIQERIKGPQVNIRTIEGRLLMVDFKEHGTRCRVHPSVGDPVLCLFDEGQKDEVLENILQYVRIAGEAKEDPTSQKITDIKIHDIECLEDRQDETADLLPQGTPILRAFWESPTLEDLARSQNVRPMADVRALFGTWPDEENDGFEAAIDELRHPGTNKDDQS